MNRLIDELEIPYLSLIYFLLTERGADLKIPSNYVKSVSVRYLYDFLSPYPLPGGTEY